MSSTDDGVPDEDSTAKRDVRKPHGTPFDLAVSAQKKSGRKWAARIWNDRLKAVTAVLQGVVLILVGVGLLRFFLDPGAPDVGLSQLSLVMLAVVALAALIVYLLGRQRPED